MKLERGQDGKKSSYKSGTFNKTQNIGAERRLPEVKDAKKGYGNQERDKRKINNKLCLKMP